MSLAKLVTFCKKSLRKNIGQEFSTVKLLELNFFCKNVTFSPREP